MSKIVFVYFERSEKKGSRTRVRGSYLKIKNYKEKAFTLMELLLYSGILIVSAGLIGGIVYTVSKANLKTQAENEVNNQMARLEEVFRQKIEAAKGVNSISGSLLELNMGNSTSTFSLGATDNTVYLQEAGGNQVALNDPTKVIVKELIFTPTGASGAQISNTYHYAWSGNVGWIDFAYSGGNVRVPTGAGDLNGGAYVLSNSSWISLNCKFTDSCSSIDYQVRSDALGNLSGWAWSESFGWISFASTTPPSYGVTVATSTGEFNGYAWSENIGWISFNCKTGGDSPANICCSQASPPSPCSDYKVRDLRMNTSAIKVDITLQYNSPKPELVISRSNSFVFNMLSPFIPPSTTTTTVPPTTTTTVPPQYYCDNDGDGHYTTTTYLSCTGSKRTSPAGDDCDDACNTCYPGSTAYTTYADGRDQDCDGTTDEIISTVCTACSYTMAEGYDYGYDNSCNFLVYPPYGIYQGTYSTTDPGCVNTAQCSCSGSTCTYSGSNCHLTVVGISGQWDVSGDTKTCNGIAYYKSIISGTHTVYHPIVGPVTSCTVTATENHYQ